MNIKDYCDFFWLIIPISPPQFIVHFWKFIVLMLLVQFSKKKKKISLKTINQPFFPWISRIILIFLTYHFSTLIYCLFLNMFHWSVSIQNNYFSHFSKLNNEYWIPYAHHYKPRLVYIFFAPFLKTISLLSKRFLQKILSLCMASIQERFVIKNGL